MRLIKRVRYEIIDGPTLKGNGPHEAEFVPALVYFDYSTSWWCGLTASGNTFSAKDLSKESLTAWLEVINAARATK